MNDPTKQSAKETSAIERVLDDLVAIVIKLMNTFGIETYTVQICGGSVVYNLTITKQKCEADEETA